MSLGEQVVRFLEKTEEVVEANRYIVYLVLGIVIAVSVVLGVAIRAAAWPRWVAIDKVYIDAFDPWIEYWLAKYLYTHGLGSWWTLKPPNPAVMKFWYPWGRDFTKTAYPLVPALIALTYPLVSSFMTLQQWAAWLPPIGAALLIIVASIYMYRRFGLLAAITTALLLALLPASMDRTLLGFIEKEGIVLFLVILSIMLLSESLANLENPLKRRLYALLSGIAAMLVGFGWGGYPLPIGTMALTIILLPAARKELRLEHIDIPILFAAGLAPAMIWARWGGSAHVLLMPGVLILAPIAYTLLVYIVRRFRVPILYEVLEWSFRRPLVYLILVFIATGLVGMVAALSGVIGGRISYLFLPGALKNIVVKREGPLVESVAEHVVDVNRVMQEASVAVIVFALFGLLYMLYRVVVLGDAPALPLLVASLVGYYGLFNAAYLLQTGSVFASLAAASLTGVAREAGVGSGGRRKRRAAGEWRPVLKVAAIIVAIILVANAAATVYANMTYYTTRLPLVLTSGVTVNIYSPAWYNFLVYIRKHTPPNTIFVSWWDYGYWLSVIGNRTTLADGATMNATQIHLLARILVGDYHEAVRLLERLRCKPNETYIVAYGVYWLIRSGKTVYAVINPFQGDIAKSYWMVRIGGFNVSHYFSPITLRSVTGELLTVNTLNIYSKSVDNALLYKLLFQAPLMLTEQGVVRLVDKRVAEFVGNSTIIPALGVITARGLRIAPLSGAALELLTLPPGFKHAIVSATPIEESGNIMAVVIVAAFKWSTTIA